MGDIQRGVTFTTSIPDAPTLHSLVDAAVILPSFISSKTLAVPGSADSFVFNKAGVLRQCRLSDLISAFPQGGAGNIFALRQLGVGATNAAAGNDIRFPASFNGIRKANGRAPDTAALAGDLQPLARDLTGLTAIDWTTAEVFSDSLTVNKTYTFLNAISGRRICVVVKLNGHTVTFPAVQNGTVPILGTGTTIQTYFFIQSLIGTSGFCIAS